MEDDEITKQTKHTTKDALHNNESDKIIGTYEAVISASNTGVWEFDIASGFLKCNDIYFSMIGRSKYDFDLSAKVNSYKLWEDLLHPQDRQLEMERFMQYINNLQEDMYESFFRLEHNDGSWVWIWSRGRYLKDKLGNNTTKIIGTHTDISAYKKAEEEIRIERALLRTLIDNLPDVIYVKNTEGRKIIANRADVLSLGARSEKEVIGKTDIELFEGDIGLRGYRDDVKVIKTGKPLLNKEECFFDKKGNKHWLLTSKVPVRDENGKTSRLLGIGHNITERKKNEESLKEAYKTIKASNKILLHLIWSNSHELRKPLCSVIGLIDILKKTTDEREKEEVIRLLEISSTQLDQIIRHNNKKATSINSTLARNEKI